MTAGPPGPPDTVKLRVTATPQFPGPENVPRPPSNTTFTCTARGAASATRTAAWIVAHGECKPPHSAVADADADAADTAGDT